MTSDSGHDLPGQRPVTIVFTDLKGSTALGERLDPESLRSLLSAYFDEMGEVFARYGGLIAKIIGDAIVAVFDASDDPTVAAQRAVVAAFAAAERLEEVNDRFEQRWGARLASRAGVASGHLVGGELGDRSDAEVLAGEVVNLAESLESNAPAMHVLIDTLTRERAGAIATTESLGQLPRKGHDGTLEGWLVHHAEPSEGLEVDGGSATSFRSARESRRTVTIIFADPHLEPLEGEVVSPEVVLGVMEYYFATMQPIIERHGGTVEKFIGDALMAVFGLPVRHEDDAARAVRAALEMRDAVDGFASVLADQFGVQLISRIGVNTGNVVAGDAASGQRLVTGDAVNVAARLEQTAGPGDVVLGEITRRLCGDLVECETLEPLTLKGKSAPVAAYRLVGIAAQGSGPRHSLPLVGRQRELVALNDTLESVRASGRAARIALLGDAGVGKSRLTVEFLAHLDGADTVSGGCIAYGDGITFWPLLRVVHSAAGIEDQDDAGEARAKLAELVDDPEVRARLEAVAGLSEVPFAVPELIWSIRRLFELLASDGPLVVVLDDIHWAEPALLEAIDELVATIEAPVMFLCTSRSQLSDEHQEFVDRAEQILVVPLTPDQCVEFLTILLEGAPVDEGALRRVGEAAGGNPLFLEQLLNMLIDVGQLRRVDGRWQVEGDLSSVEIPASIEALLAARIDRLPPEARLTVEPASVIGSRFPHDAVGYLASDHVPNVDGALDELQHRDLITPEPDEPASIFQHKMIRDATYNGLLKETRAEFHERFVAWADQVNSERDRANEFEEIQGHHLEQAYRYRQQLGYPQDELVGLGERASTRLSSAGRRSLGRGDMRAAANLLTRAADLLEPDHAERSSILLAAGNALFESGSFDEAIEAYDRAEASAGARSDRPAQFAASIERTRLRYLIGRVDSPTEVEEEVEQVLEALADSASADALSRAWQLRLNLEIANCRWSDAQHAASLVIENARTARNGVLEVRTMPLLAFLAQKGPMHVDEATVVCQDILERVSFDRRSTALTQLELAMLSAMDCDVDRARALTSSTRNTLLELGWEMQAALVSLSSGPIELLAGEAARAEAELRRDHDALTAMGEANFISLTSTLLADACYRQRRFDEASKLLDDAVALAAPDDLAVHIIANGVRAKVAARAGGVTRARSHIDLALMQVDGTDDPSGQADVRLDQAEVLALIGEPQGALNAAQEAAKRYAVKGNRLGERRAARVAARLEAGTDPLGDAT